MDKRPLLISFLGFPGSGKTYFSTQLVKKIGAVTYNSDALRIAMFKNEEAIEVIRRSKDRARLYEDVFGAMDYATKQSLLAGQSVVYDAQQTKRENRRNVERIASEAGAVAVLVWIKTNKAVAMRRGQEREASDNSHRYSAEKMKMLVDRFESVTELPTDDENLIVINGEHDFSEQYASFVSQLRTIVNK